MVATLVGQVGHGDDRVPVSAPPDQGRARRRRGGRWSRVASRLSDALVAATVDRRRHERWNRPRPIVASVPDPSPDRPRSEPPRPWGALAAAGADSTGSGRRVEARLFGPFELRIDGEVVGGWRGQRGLGVLKHVLSRPKRSSPRDVLLDTMWPYADPDRARNRLQVAVSSVRRTVRRVADVDILEHRDGSYRIPADVGVSTDVDEFERLVAAGRRAEAQGDPTTAADAYEEAVALYRGDFLAEDLYEDWTSLRRETLRVTYLDVLDRLAQLHISSRRVGQCIEVAQLILRQDPSREDAHRLLMRSYAAQGRVGQVDRQFEICRRTLCEALATPPAAATVELYRTVRVEATEARGRDWSFA